MRLLLDESLSRRMVAALMAAGHDVVHVGDVGLLGAPDEDVLSFAVQDHRTSSPPCAGAALEGGALIVVEHERLRVRERPIAPKD